MAAAQTRNMEAAPVSGVVVFDGNRFPTQDDCKSHCVEPEGIRKNSHTLISSGFAHHFLY